MTFDGNRNNGLMCSVQLMAFHLYMTIEWLGRWKVGFAKTHPTVPALYVHCAETLSAMPCFISSGCGAGVASS